MIPVLRLISRSIGTAILALAAATPAVAQTQSVQTQPAARVTAASNEAADYRIGADDVLKITVLEAADLNQTLRVSASGEITMPLIGSLKVAGLSAPQVEKEITDRLRQKYIRNPNVAVQVSEIHSHTVSVMGAVKKPGMFQLRGPRTVLEVLSLAEGLADDAGELVLIVRGDQAADTTEVRLRDLMESRDARLNVVVNPGDVVKVTRQGVVYVVGEVKKPGAFVARNGGRQTALHALAMCEGLGPTAAGSRAVIFRLNAKGERDEIAVDLDRVLKGRAPDVLLQSEDVLFVPQSGAKAVGRAAAEIALRVLGFRIPFVR